METFLPSEVARLVYGYLEEENCPIAAQAFLESSMHLKECLDVAKKGKKFNTRMYGLSLIDILDLLMEAISFVREHKNEIANESKKKYRLLNLLQVENFFNSNIPESLDDKCSSKEEPSLTINKSVIFDSRQAKEDERFTKGDGDPKNNLEGLGCRIGDVLSNKKRKLNMSIKKEEADEEGDCIMGEEFSNGCSNLQPIQPDVEILSPCSLPEINSTMTMHEPPNLTPIMVSGRPSQIICPQYNMVQMVPTGCMLDAPSLHPNVPSTTVYFPTGTAIPQRPVMSVQALPPVQPEIPPQQNYMPLPTLSQTRKPVTYQTSVITSASKSVLRKPKIMPVLMESNQVQQIGSTKLRPIAPKLVHSSKNGLVYQQFQNNDIPLFEINSVILKKSARFRTTPYLSIP